MKKGWQTKTLADLCKVFADGDWVESKDQSPEGIRLIQTGNVGEGVFKDRGEKARYISEGTFKRLRCTEIFEGDCLISRLPDPAGRSCLLPDTGERMITAVDCTIVRFNPRQALPEFFNYYSQSRDYLSAVDGETTGTTRKRISRSKLAQIFIPVPPLPEQQRIVGILDEAFEGIAVAKINAEKNLQNARALFESHLQSVFIQRGGASTEVQTNPKSPTRSMPQEASQSPAADAEMARLNAGYVTKTGGREATLRHIPGNLSLAVGMPSTGARKGWRWSALTDLARLESGHTPSRRHPEYWGGSVPWIGIQDARENHGQRITDTFQKTNELGIANSSARVLPENTVCLSRTASVGYVIVMGRPMATSQDFVNWVCTPKLNPDFLKYLFLAEGRDGLCRYASGAVHQTIYFPEAKAFHICHPGTEEQFRIVRQCDALNDATQRLKAIYQRKLAALDELKKSLLHQAFTGNL